MRKPFPLAPIVYVALLMTPVFWLIGMSFKTNAEIAGATTLLPVAPTLQNFAVVLGDPDWAWGYVNALIYVSMNVVISIIVALPAAYALSRFPFVGARALLFGFLLFRMLAPAILLVPFIEIFARLGMIDTHLAVALAHCFFNVPLAIWMLEGFISAVPKEIDESAAIDGHSQTSFLLRILVPIIAPGIAATAFFCFLFSWVEYLLANALTTVDAKPIAGIMTRAGGVLVGDYGILAAASVVGMLPGVLLVVFMRKHLVRGFSLGRVTG
jgi:glycerol transport system permease protein